VAASRTAYVSTTFDAGGPWYFIHKHFRRNYQGLSALIRDPGIMQRYAHA